MPTRLMLDSNVFDAILEDVAMFEDVRRVAATGEVEILVTHVQVDELVDTIGRDPERLKRLLHTLLRSGAQEVATYGIVLNRSRLDLARFATQEDSARIAAFQEGNPEHIEDALIAATAEYEGAILVTAEVRRRRYSTYFPNLVVWTPDDLQRLAREAGTGDEKAMTR